MDQIWNQIKFLAKQATDHPYFQVEQAGISRPMLKKYVDTGKLQRVRKGIYILADGFADEYVLLQEQSSKSVFSYGTALFFGGCLIGHRI